MGLKTTGKFLSLGLLAQVLPDSTSTLLPSGTGLWTYFSNKAMASGAFELRDSDQRDDTQLILEKGSDSVGMGSSPELYSGPDPQKIPT